MTWGISTQTQALREHLSINLEPFAARFFNRLSATTTPLVGADGGASVFGSSERTAAIWSKTARQARQAVQCTAELVVSGVERLSPVTDRAAPRVEQAMEWARRQRGQFQAYVPQGAAVEAWARENATRLGWAKRPRSGSLEHIEAVLVATAAAISQQTSRNARRFIGLVFAKAGGALSVGGITGLVSSYGLASTGTAIATLHGVAAQTALYYWFGSLVGAGVAAGALFLTGLGIFAGVVLSIAAVRIVLGRPRRANTLEEHEAAILDSCAVLIKAIRDQIANGEEPTPTQMRLFAAGALVPLADEINRHWDNRALAENGVTGCRPFTRTLAWFHRRRLDHNRTEIGRIAMALMNKDAQAV